MTAAFSSNQTRLENEGSIVRGQVNMIAGDWAFNTTTTPQAISLGKEILCGGITNEEFTTPIVSVLFNTPDVGDLYLKPASGNSKGTYWAIVRI
jgi:hypothetical protein